jgi:glycosyltransferase involved in cell wall biosynthesis
MGELADGMRDERLSRITPWPAGQFWRGPACEAAIYLGECIPVAQATGYAELPRQMAILWEQRDDLRRIYDLAKPDGCNNYIAWCLITGIEDGLVVPDLIDDAFWEQLDGPALAGPGYKDIPISRALAIFHAAHHAGATKTTVSEDPLSWLELALWVLLTASGKYRWPAAMTKSLQAYANAPVPSLTVHGVALPRLLLMVWDSRADLRADFDLFSAEGRTALLSWFLFVGLEEYGISRDALPAAFLRQLWNRPDNGALPLAHRLILSRRPDLISRFNTTTELGRSAYLGWFGEYGVEDIDDARFLVGLVEPIPEVRPVRASRASAPPPIVLTGHIHRPSGRGEDIRMTMRALAAQRLPFVTLDRDDGLVRDAEGHVIDSENIAEAHINILHLNAESAFPDYQFLRRYRIGKARLIGYWAWELPKFPAEFSQAFSFVDAVWAATKFARDAFDIGYRPITLMPMAVEIPTDLPPVDRSYFRLPLFRFLFLFNFDFKSHVTRKNPGAAITAFRRAFPRSDERVALMIKTINAESHPGEWQELRNLIGDDRRIILRDCQYTREEMSQLISLCDCYVSLHRSEGFGRGPAEAMLQGKPVIATNYSGNTDFMNADNSFLVDYRLEPVAEGAYPGACGQVWAEPDIAHAAAQMRRVYEDPEHARNVGARAVQFVLARHNAAEIGRIYRERLCELASQLADPSDRPVTVSSTEILG